MGRVKYCPSLFVHTDKPGKYKTIKGQQLGKVSFDSIRDAKKFIEDYKDVDNYPIYGNRNFEYCWIADNNPGKIEWSAEHIRVCNIDIEVGSENGFPHPQQASEALQAITIRVGGEVVAFGCGAYTPSEPGVRYIKCDDEIDLINEFMTFWCSDYPDVITGWYVKFFDIPYLINRITKLLGEEVAKKLSPWGHYYKRTVIFQATEHECYVIQGIATLDYQELYKKFEDEPRENYKLETISYVELKEKKLSYEEYGNLHTLYKEDYQKFMDYNVRDTKLVELIDNKKGFLDLAFALAYDSKVNFEDVFMQTRMWDCLVFNHLKQRHVILPEKRGTPKQDYVGAWVKEPNTGKHRWIVSFDFTSLYPKLMITFNISPEMIIDERDWPQELRQLITQNVSVESLLDHKIDLSILKKYNVSITPNRQFFRRHAPGFMGEILTRLFNERQEFKKKSKDHLKLSEAAIDKKEKDFHYELYKKYNTYQKVKKVCLNSCYGALGNEFFRLFDVRQAEAITTSGQLAILWVIKRVNIYLNKLLATDNIDYVLAADTDSCYISLDKLVSKFFETKEKYTEEETKKIISFLIKVCQTQLQPFIDKACQDYIEYANAFVNELSMKHEKVCDVGIITSKKHYVWNVWFDEGVLHPEPEMKVVGLDMVKSSLPEFCRKKLKESTKIIINGTEADIHTFVKETRKTFNSMRVEDIASPRGMHGLLDYTDKDTIYKKGTPIHVRGSLLFNHYIRKKKLDKKYPLIKEGEKIKYCYLKLPNVIKEDVICFVNQLPKELDLHTNVDYATMYDKTFLEPMRKILDVIGWKTERKKSLF